jgi:hypothetical protein
MNDKWSNCWLEAIKAKIKNPKGVKILFTIGACLPFIHFCWTENNKLYGFAKYCDEGSFVLNVLFFEGRVVEFKSYKKWERIMLRF